jgi:mono/diheme cytochrome c family protein
VDRAIQELRSTKLPAILARHGVMVAQTTRDTEALPADLRSARSTYLTQCSQCHGIDASGTPAAANLRAFKGSEDDFIRIVRNGRAGTGMTPWKGLITDDEIRNIARYVKGLSGGTERP